MIVINNIDDKRFSLNGIKYFKNFTPHVVDENIRIVNTYDSTFTLLNWTPYDQFEVDGSTFNNVSDLQTALLPVLYTRGTLGGGSGGATLISELEDVDLQDLVDGGILRYDAGSGKWIVSVLADNSNNQLIQKFTIDAVQDDTTQLTSSGVGKIGIEYNEGTGNVSAFLFNQIYSSKLAVIAEYVDVSNLQIQLYNYTTQQYYTCKILSFDTVGSYKRANICESMVNDFLVNDVVDFQVVVSNSVSSENSTVTTTTNITDLNTTFDGSQKGLNNIYEFNNVSAQTVTIDADDYTQDDIGIIQRGYLGGTLEILPDSGQTLKGVRDINNRFFVNDLNSFVSFKKDIDGKILIFGNLTRGYTGAVTTTSYTELIESGGAQDITVIGTGFSANMLDPVLTGNATLNSWTYVNNNQITLNITPSGVATDLITVTYDNGDIFIDTDAIEIQSTAPSYDTADLRHYYPLDVNSNDAVAVNPISGTDTSMSYAGGYAVFNGTTSKVTLSDDDSFSYGNGSTDAVMSISLTVNADSFASGHIFGKYDSGTNGEYRLAFVGGTTLKFQCRDVSQPATLTMDYDISGWSTGTDYHIVITKTGTTNAGLKLYVNGVLVTTVNSTSGTYVSMENTNADLIFGDLGTGTDYFDGKERRLGFWNVELDATQVADVYTTEITNNNNLL